MENGGLGSTIIGSIGDACLSADCCFRDIASFHKNNYAICLFSKKSRGRFERLIGFNFIDIYNN